MIPRWFVVGGAGFIGTNLARRRPCAIYDLRNDHDALDLDRLTYAMSGYETVVHLAANADIAAGALDPNLDLDGITITRNVAEAARANGVKRIIYTSGSGVYGHASADWPTEQTACYPISAYGASKLASEAVLHAYEQYGIEVVIFRPANVVGPHQTHGVGCDFLAKLRADPTHLEILGDGKQTKGYLHIDDLLGAFDIAPAGTWNVGPEDALSVDEIADLAIEREGLRFVNITRRGGLAWPGDIPLVRLDCTALRAQSWAPLATSAGAMRLALAAM